MLKRSRLFEFDFISESEIDKVVTDIVTNIPIEINNCMPFLITPNVDYIVKLDRKENADLKSILLNSKYVLPDGQPIVWGSNILNKGLKKRLTGSDLFPLLWNECKRRNENVLALTSSDIITSKLLEDNTKSICYTLPFFQRDNERAFEAIVEKCTRLIINCNIKIVFIGVSFPKQDIIAIKVYNELKSLGITKFPLFCMLGASFEFYTNDKKRAPVHFQRLGLEWFYRFYQEPRRLFKRYFVDGLDFINIFIKTVINRS